MRTALFFLCVACSARPLPPPDAGVPRQVTLTARDVDTRFVTAEQMMAASELHASGALLARAMRRELGGYRRVVVPADTYFDPSVDSPGPWVDLAGFSSAIESYGYSQTPVAFVAFESGAGTSLARSDAGVAALGQRLLHYGELSGALGRYVFEPGTWPVGNVAGNVNPSGQGAPERNPLGWPGLWPTLHAFDSADPAVDPVGTAALWCSISADDTTGGTSPAGCADYECDATSLHLKDRAAQVESSISPGADGFSGWRYATAVLEAQQSTHPAPDGGAALGPEPIAGFRAALLVEQLDARAEDWLFHLTTTDGATLSGFASVEEAMGYGWASELRWFPGRLSVAADESVSVAGSPALLGEVGLVLAYATALAATADGAWFGGDPFSSGQLRDRSLAMLRVSLVNLERLHADPSSAALLDDGTKASTVTTAYAAVALRAALRAMSGQLRLAAEREVDLPVAALPLDSRPSGRAETFSARVKALLGAQGALLMEHLTTPEGRAFTGWDVMAQQPASPDESLEAHAAAVRGLMALYLSTAEVKYRARAVAVFERLQAKFYDAEARVYSETPAPVDSVTYTPQRFALLQGALREVYEVWATRPGNEALALELESRIGRLNKLVLNGWDDRDQDRHVDWPGECVRQVDGRGGGGLMLAERTLTGELGALSPNPVPLLRQKTVDRELDCVPEVDDAHLPAVLARRITFDLSRAP
ncbi:MAG: hypothetical protein IPJ65_02590 [Archangiaceae bacterium]|nr:hypothetical protein [Archangiaceae bacterium]